MSRPPRPSPSSAIPKLVVLVKVAGCIPKASSLFLHPLGVCSVLGRRRLLGFRLWHLLGRDPPQHLAVQVEIAQVHAPGERAGDIDGSAAARLQPLRAPERAGRRAVPGRRARRQGAGVLRGLRALSGEAERGAVRGRCTAAARLTRDRGLDLTFERHLPYSAARLGTAQGGVRTF